MTNGLMQIVARGAADIYATGGLIELTNKIDITEIYTFYYDNNMNYDIKIKIINYYFEKILLKYTHHTLKLDYTKIKFDKYKFNNFVNLIINLIKKIYNSDINNYKIDLITDNYSEKIKYENILIFKLRKKSCVINKNENENKNKNKNKKNNQYTKIKYNYGKNRRFKNVF